MFTFNARKQSLAAAAKTLCLAAALSLPFLTGAPAPAAAQDGGQQKSIAEQQGRNPLDPVAAPDPSVEAAKPAWMKQAKDNDPALAGGTALDKPHLTPREVREWASNAVADVLNFSYTNFDERLASFPKYFSQTGFKQYNAYLEQAKMRQVLNDYRYEVTGVVVNVPYIAEEKSVAGYYRWLVEVPVMMSYLEQNQGELDKNKIPLTDDLLVTIEISRVPEPKLTQAELNQRSMMDNMNVVINTWTVKRRKRN